MILERNILETKRLTIERFLEVRIRQHFKLVRGHDLWQELSLSDSQILPFEKDCIIWSTSFWKTILVPYNFNEWPEHVINMICRLKRLMNDAEGMSQQWISVLWTRCTSLLALNPVVHAVAFPGWKFKSGFKIYSFITGLIILISLH